MSSDIVIFGGLLLDRYFYIDRWPQQGQDGFFDREESFVGGCAINMAVTIHNLGGQAHVVSCLGSDSVGHTIRDYLAQHHLSQALVHPAAGDTGSCLVFVEPEGERTFLTRKGAEGVFPPELAAKIPHLSPAWAGVTGYYLLGEDTPRILDCLEELHQNGTKLLFDPSPLAGDIPAEHLARMIAISDVLTPNTTELPILVKDGDLSTLTQAGKAVLLKRGAAGGTVYTQTETFDYASVPCDAVDTTGAGDSFSGALLHAMTCGRSLRQSVELAAACAAKTVQLRGPHGFWNLEESIHA